MSDNEKNTAELQNEIENARSIEDILHAHTDTLPAHSLSEYLSMLLKKKDLKRAEIIRRAGLDRNYAYHIFAGEKTPTRPKVLAIALAFELSPREADYLLYYAGAGRLYARNLWDQIIIYALKNHWSVDRTNEQLLALGETEFLG